MIISGDEQHQIVRLRSAVLVAVDEEGNHFSVVFDGSIRADFVLETEHEFYSSRLIPYRSEFTGSVTSDSAKIHYAQPSTTVRVVEQEALDV